MAKRHGGFGGLCGVRQAQISIALPLCVHLRPLVLGKPVDLGGGTVVLASAAKVVQVLLTRSVPISAQLFVSCKSTLLRYIGYRLNAEVGMAKLVSPWVVGVFNEHWRYV